MRKALLVALALLSATSIVLADAMPEYSSLTTDPAESIDGSSSVPSIDYSPAFDEIASETLRPVSLACTLTCPANITKANDPNQCGAVENYPAPTSAGTCGAITCSPASGSFFPIGTTTITCAESVGPSSCSFTVTINDTQPPTITCPANITKSNDPNQCGAVVNYPPPIATDNCPGVTVNSTPASGSFFPVGTTTVTATATDGAGNTASCTFTVTVNDTQPPTITCPANIATSTTSASGAVVNYPPPTVSDNCPGVTVNSSPPSGSTFPIGTTTVTATATDAHGNTATCTFTVTVVAADVSVSATASPNPVLAGTNVTFTATVQNLGPSTATGVTLTDTVPAGASFVSASSSQGTCSGNPVITCTIGTLGNGGTATVTIVMQAPLSPGTMNNTMSVSANEFDQNMANNSTTTAVAVVFNANIPTLSGWSLLLLVFALASIGWWMTRRV